jgi:group I intron endonuclease
MEENNKNLWEEKNSIEQQKNCESNQTSVPNDTIKETNQKLTENQWNDIGKISGIYKIINKVNGKYYVGSSVDIKRRWIRGHRYKLNNNKHNNFHLQCAWNKYGKENFILEIIELVDNSNLIEKEQEFLNIALKEIDKCYNQKFKANNNIVGYESVINAINLYNKNKTISRETRIKISNSAKNKILSNSTRSKISKSLIGDKNPFYGKHHSEDAKEKQRIAKLGKKHNIESRKKMSESLKIRQFGENNPSYDSTKYNWINTVLNIEEYCTQYELYKKYNLNRGNVNAILRKKAKSHKGWGLKYD